MMSRRSLSLPLVLALSVALVGCGDEDPAGPVSPVATITSPTSGASVSEGTTITLEGSAADPQDGALGSAALAWSSSIDGDLGTGTSVEISAPSLGVHTITLTATDIDGNTGSTSIAVSVEALAFLDGTVGDPQIGFVVNSTGNAISLFQLGNPTETRSVALGASSAVTAGGISIRGERGAVPLGNAASVAMIDLRSLQITGFYLFDGGNATGSAFVDDETVVVANQSNDIVGKFSLSQSGTSITDTVRVAEFPNDVITVSDSLVLIVSSFLDDAFSPLGDGIVTAIDPRTMTVIDTVSTGGQNPQQGEIGPDGLLYVVNTGDYVNPSSMAIIDPATMTRLDVVDGFPSGSGDVHISSDGVLYTSAFFGGTAAWDTEAGDFIRDGSDPICAPLAGGGCRGAFAAHTDADGNLYQTFFGSASQGLPPQVFRYAADTYALTDSIESAPGPVGLVIRAFR
ncbi:MAG: hypothetical protein AAF389_09650 [Gemmatimonadota bacterium]